jgi:tRNA (mo5U34)-methyltransferase
VASFLKRRSPDVDVEFRVGDVYETARQFDAPFDVTLCLGGLYHVADPPFVLRQLRAVTSEYLIVQTSSIIRGRRNRAEFRVRGDATKKGLSSIVAGSGKWYMTAACFREILRHGGFEVVEQRESRPMFSALCRVT